MSNPRNVTPVRTRKLNLSRETLLRLDSSAPTGGHQDPTDGCTAAGCATDDCRQTHQDPTCLAPHRAGLAPHRAGLAPHHA